MSLIVLLWWHIKDLLLIIPLPNSAKARLSGCIRNKLSELLLLLGGLDLGTAAHVRALQSWGWPRVSRLTVPSWELTLSVLHKINISVTSESNPDSVILQCS